MNSTVFLLSALVLAAVANARNIYQCQPCKGEECNVQPEGCKYGIAKDICGRWQCMVGPGQRCGGRDNHLGKCGDGMTCDCNMCRGCSTEMFNRGILECTKTSMPICY